MQSVVSNSSPIIHLSKIERLNLLRDYFQEIVIPEAVYRECITEGKGRCEIELIKNADYIKRTLVKDNKLVRLLQSTLDDGESEAIALSLEVQASLILLDDSEAREKARLYGLKITGIIGILLRAKRERKIPSLKDELKQLKETGFWIAEDLEATLLNEVGE
ncbi:MAG: DUF3368 domain-containing protein [Planctomycetes bacterium]|nr:DUF3368 domain-containing protein [Planctomycetota bacterium]